MFDALLDKLMIQEYKREVNKEGDPSRIDANVEAGWELLVKKGGIPKRYHDAVLKVDCGNLVEDLIANFERRHGVSGDALTYYVGVILHNRVFGGDGLDTYRPSEEDQSGTNEGGGDETDEDDEEDDSCSESVLMDVVASVDEEEGGTVDKGGKGVPLYGRKSRILLGSK